MSFTATTASLQKRTEEAIRYAIDCTLGHWGYVYETATATATITIALDSDLTLTAGDMILVGTQSRTVVTLTPIFPSVPQRYTAVLSSAVTAAVSDVVRFDYSANVRRSDDMRTREAIPWLCFVQCINIKQDDPGSNYYTGNLVVSLHSLFNTITADDGEAVTDASLITDLAPHEAKVTAITGILSDPVTLWNLVKPGATNRPISDLGIVAILNAEQPGSASVDGMHNFEIRKTIRIIDSD